MLAKFHSYAQDGELSAAVKTLEVVNVQTPDHGSGQIVRVVGLRLQTDRFFIVVAYGGFSKIRDDTFSLIFSLRE